MNYVSFCKMYFSVTHIPVSLMKKNEAIYSSIGEVCSVKAARYWEMAPSIPTFVVVAINRFLAWRKGVLAIFPSMD